MVPTDRHTALGGGTWLACLAFIGLCIAGEPMLQEASPAQHERMPRLAILERLS